MILVWELREKLAARRQRICWRKARRYGRWSATARRGHDVPPRCFSRRPEKPPRRRSADQRWDATSGTCSGNPRLLRNEFVAAGRPEWRNRHPMYIAILAESLKWPVDVNCGANTKKDRG
jgi:hypothetical protein